MAGNLIRGGAVVELLFPRTGNAWIDAGIVGLYRVLRRRETYAVPTPPQFVGEEPGSEAFPSIRADLFPDRMVVTGPREELQRCLERAYDCLICSYFNVSSEKQKSDVKSHNFYLDTSNKQFVRFAKKRPAGAALLLFDKAVRPAGEQQKWGVDSESGKPRPGRMPESFGHLQAELDKFLADTCLKPGPPAGLLIDGENEVRPKMEFRVDAKVGKGLCFLTGLSLPGLSEAKNTAFPLFGGSRSFVNETQENLRIGWQLDFLGKFVPAVAFFYLQGDDLHIFFAASHTLTRIAYMAEQLRHMVVLEPNLFRNFDLHLGGYYQGRSEVALAFLHRVFVELSKHGPREAPLTQPVPEARTEDSLSDNPDALMEQGQVTATEPEISAQAVYDTTLRGGAVTFTVVSATKKGNVWMARDFWTFQDVVYLSRLFEALQEREQLRSGLVRLRCRPKSFMNALIDFDAKKDKTILRDQVCAAILLKHPVLPLLEHHAWQVYAQSDPEKPRRVSPLLDFAIVYEVERYEGSVMTKDDYKKMVEKAKWLGTNIADGVVEAVQDKARQESFGRAKGAFFQLRKSRTKGQFLDELIRLKNRYPKIELPPEALEPDIFNDASFDEYRGFCVLAGLSRFQWKAQSQRPTTLG
jgi:hypothetical protein